MSAPAVEFCCCVAPRPARQPRTAAEPRRHSRARLVPVVAPRAMGGVVPMAPVASLREINARVSVGDLIQRDSGSGEVVWAWVRARAAQQSLETYFIWSFAVSAWVLFAASIAALLAALLPSCIRRMHTAPTSTSSSWGGENRVRGRESSESNSWRCSRWAAAGRTERVERVTNAPARAAPPGAAQRAREEAGSLKAFPCQGGGTRRLEGLQQPRCRCSRAR